MELKKRGASAIDLLGTSLTFYRGAAFNEKLLGDIRKATGLKATSMSTAVIDGLKRRRREARRRGDGVQRGSEPAPQHVSRRVGLRGRGDEGARASRRSAIPARSRRTELQKFSADVFKQASKADALLVSCGGLRTLEILAPLEKETRVPVVSSLPHSLWAGMRLLGLKVKAPGYGRLLANG